MERAFSCPKTQECWREQEWLSKGAAESTYSATLGGSLLSFLLLSWLTFRLLDRQGSIFKATLSQWGCKAVLAKGHSSGSSAEF